MPQAWVEALHAKDGWFRLDQAQRRLETWVANLDDDPPEERRSAWFDAPTRTRASDGRRLHKALVKAGWTVPGVLHQTHIYSEVVAEQPKPVAYFLVDAMRFEMGVELAERLPKTAEVSVRPAVGALPSITPDRHGGAQPGASASFSVVEQGGKLGARIDGSIPARPRGSEEVRRRARAEAGRHRARRAAEPVSPRSSRRRSRARRSSSFARRRSTMPARRASPSRPGRSWTPSSTTWRARSASSPQPASSTRS